MDMHVDLGTEKPIEYHHDSIGGGQNRIVHGCEPNVLDRARAWFALFCPDRRCVHAGGVTSHRHCYNLLLDYQRRFN
jgi:hypothetical protein